MTPTPKAVQASAIRSSSVVTNTPLTPGTRRAASTLRWISGLGVPPAPFQLDQRLARIARRSEARRDQDDRIHRAAGQSWICNTPTGLPLVDHEQGRDAVLVEQCQRLVDQRSPAPIVLGLAVMKTDAG